MTTTPPSSDETPPRGGVSRRGVIGLFTAGGAGLALGAIGGAAAGSSAQAARSLAPTAGLTYPFYGARQAGITTPAQDRMHVAAFDLARGITREKLIALLQEWTDASARMTQGLEVGETGAVNGSDFAPPTDTGEALGLEANGLTITFGFGPGLFTDADGSDRFGVADQRPSQLTPLPRFAGDALRPEWTGGDLCIQACANDPQVAVHAIRNLSRIAFGRASIKWSQIGFGRTSSTSTTQTTPRNLFGFKDGTANIKAEDRNQVNDHVWVGDDDQPWLTGGSYLVTRKIRMLIEVWDRQQLLDQEVTIGRNKGEGAPLSGGREFTALDLEAEGPTGEPLIARDSHVRLASPEHNGGARLLRRGYNYVDGNDELGTLNAGLFFISYQRSPEQFIRVQTSLARDALNEYIKHVGSGIFAVPPGATSGGYIGETLFGSRRS